MHSDVAAVRVCAPPKSEDSQMREIGELPEDAAANREYFGRHDVSLENHLEYIFDKRGQRGQVASRFTNGSLPVFYSALDPDTAKAEKAHWLQPVLSPFNFQLVAVDFRGFHKNLGELDPVPPHLTGEKELGSYDACHQITAEAVADRLDAFQTPSARRPGGHCFPILTRGSVHALRPRGLVRFSYDPAQRTWTAE
jgi:RES domain